MPNIGDRISGIKVGYKTKAAVTWTPCSRCGTPRWVHIFKNGSPKRKMCTKCRAELNGISERRENHPLWKGGRVMTNDGYIAIRIASDDFFFPMTTRKAKLKNGGYVLEHRYIMAKHLGRNLSSWEIVHHKNGIKTDNRIENLELSSSISQHIVEHSKGYRDGYSKGLIDGRNKQIEKLKEEINLLQLQIRELNSSYSLPL